MSPSWNRSIVCLAHFPRVSGDEPWSTIWEGIKGVFSPRERG